MGHLVIQTTIDARIGVLVSCFSESFSARALNKNVGSALLTQEPVQDLYFERSSGDPVNLYTFTCLPDMSRAPGARERWCPNAPNDVLNVNTHGFLRMMSHLPAGRGISPTKRDLGGLEERPHHGIGIARGSGTHDLKDLEGWFGGDVWWISFLNSGCPMGSCLTWESEGRAVFAQTSIVEQTRIRTN